MAQDNYESSLQGAVSTFNEALGANPLERVRLDQGFDGVAAVVRSGVETGKRTPTEAMEYLASIAGQAAEVALSRDDTATQRAFTARQSTFLSTIAFLGTAPKPASPTATEKKPMSGKKDI